MPLSSPSSFHFPLRKKHCAKVSPGTVLLRHVPFPPPWQCHNRFQCHGWKSAHPLGHVACQPTAFGLEAEWEERGSGLGSLLSYFQESLINDSGSLLWWVMHVLAWALHAQASMLVAAREPGRSRSSRGILQLPARWCMAGD